MRHAARVSLSLLIALAAGYASALEERAPAIVIGFVGGMVRHDNLIHSEVQLAENLRRDYPSGVYAAVFENRRRENAHREILRLLDVNRDGLLSAVEKRNARVILYGHSWGAAITVALARELDRDGIKVLLTIQVDSIRKFGQEDSVIPSNVAEAVNFYQPSGILRGRRQIRAADPERTQVIGNFRVDYSGNPIKCEQYPWFARTFAKSHIQIECDPSMWNQVEALIRSKL